MNDRNDKKAVSTAPALEDHQILGVVKVVNWCQRNGKEPAKLSRAELREALRSK